MSSNFCVQPLLNAIEHALVVVDSAGAIVMVNDAAERLLGPGHRLCGRRFIDTLKTDLEPRLKESKSLYEWLEITTSGFGLALLAPLEDRSCEITYCTGEGDRTLFAYASAILSRDGKSSGILYSFYDSTGLRRAEKVLEAVSEAARQVNSDLQVKEMLPSLYEVVGDRVPLDGMAIVIIKDTGRAVVLGSIPKTLMGGAGASAHIPPPVSDAEVLIDLVSDIQKALEAEPGDAVRPLLPRAFLEEADREGYHSLVALPLTIPGQVIGIWVLASKELKSYSHADMAFLEPVSGHLATAIKNATLLETTKEMYSAAVRALAATVDIRDSYTMHHSEHVAMVARRVAEEMGLPPDEVEVIELAGLVHDIGKIGIPDSILQKPGPLGPAERSIMTHHSILGASILERAGMLADLAPLVLHHHEWHNGSGYPDRLNGSEIPIGAAILSVADALDTMISDRNYRPGMSVEEAKRELERCAGAQFNPDVVRALKSVLKRAEEKNEAWYISLTGDNAAEARRTFGYGESRTLAEQSKEYEQFMATKSLDVLAKVAQEMRKLSDLPELLDNVCRIVTEDMGCSGCDILTPGTEGEYLEVIASAGSTLGYRVPAGQGISWWVMNKGVLEIIPDAQMDERFYPSPGKARSEVYVPLETRGRRLGVLIAKRAEKDGFRQVDARTLMAVAGHLASALEATQLHDKVKRLQSSMQGT